MIGVMKDNIKYQALNGADEDNDAEDEDDPEGLLGALGMKCQR
jgi:hypothetical protein